MEDFPPSADSKLVNWVRVHLSANYLYSAFQSASRSQDLELHGDRADNGVRLEHRAHVIASVTSAAAFLESCVNELFSSAEDPFDFPLELGDDVRRQLHSLWRVERFRLARVLEKYEAALYLTGKEAFDRGASPYQEANLLLQLRNALVHYAPTTFEIEDGVTEDLSPDDFAKRLGSKFPENPWAAQYMLITPDPKPRKTTWPYFPERCLGSGCAIWAAKSSLRFADEFFDRFGMQPFYVGVRDDLPELAAG